MLCYFRNALQVTWARQKGRFVMQLNYSFQKAMGIVSPSGGQAALDPLVAAGLAYPCGCTRQDIARALAVSGHARVRHRTG